MTSPRPPAILATLAASLAIACGPKHIAPAPQPTAQALVVLLQDSDTRTTGRAFVSNASGSVDLTATRDSTVATANQPPSPVSRMSDAEVQRVFGAALAALPPPPHHFTLYFRFESLELTDESRAFFPEILQRREAARRPGGCRRRAHGHPGRAADERRARVEAGRHGS